MIQNLKDLTDRQLLEILLANQIQLSRKIQRLENHHSQNSKNYYSSSDIGDNYKADVEKLFCRSKEVLELTNEWLKEFEEFTF